jgi:hypothetical protein
LERNDQLEAWLKSELIRPGCGATVTPGAARSLEE